MHSRLFFGMVIFAALQSTFMVAAQRRLVSMMRAAVFEVGGPEKLRVGEVPRPILRSDDILIKVHSTALNRADTLQRQGLYPSPPGESDILGLEAAGEVVEACSSCGWAVGDRVMALLSGGGNAEYVRVNHQHVMPIPDTLSMLEAGGIPEAWLTAFQLLHLVGQLQPGEKVLIHAGASGVGTAAVQLCRLAGCVPYITAGSREKVDLAVGLGAEMGFNYKEEDWAKALRASTNDSGVDLVLDCVGGSYWSQNIEVLGKGGRWVLYGLLGGPNVNGPILRSLLSKQISLLATTLRPRSTQYKAGLVKAFTEQALPHFGTKLKPVIQQTFPLERIGEAHALMESNKSTGKILLSVLNAGAPAKDEL